jgi:TPR repeat protein
MNGEQPVPSNETNASSPMHSSSPAPNADGKHRDTRFCDFPGWFSSQLVSERMRWFAHDFKIAADLGDAIAHLIYQICLHEGEGVRRDLKGATPYFKLAADQGDAIAQFLYGVCLYKAEGVRIDFKGVAHYFKLAADQGIAVAQYNYGFCLHNGKGVSIDFELAAHYFKLAADQ